MNDQYYTLWIVKVGSKCLNPSKGAREQLVTNLRSIQRSFGSNSRITCDTIIRRNSMET